MKKLITTDITTTIGMPVKAGTWNHLQAAYQEGIAEGIKAVIGSGYNSAVVYILNGLVNQSTHPTYNVTAGSVFYNGEVYLVDAATFTLTGSNLAVLTGPTISYYTGIEADGVEFTDGIVRNVHQIRKMTLTQALGGSGVSNYVDMQRINSNIPQVNIIQGAGIGVSGTYPNITVTNTLPDVNKIIQSGTIPIGDLNTTTDLDSNTTLLSGGSSGFAGYRYIFPVAIGHTNYLPIIMVGHDAFDTVSDMSQNYMCGVLYGKKSATDMFFFIQTTATGNAQTLQVKYMLISTV